MEGEIRVTVIATGFDKTLGQEEKAAARPGAQAGVLPFPQKTPRVSAPVTVSLPSAVGKKPAAPQLQHGEVSEMEIPTFIRRQMD